MNFFTQTVDATLWSSRAYDDPEYDEDEVAAESSRSEMTLNLSVARSEPLLLIAACGPAARSVLSVALKLNEIGSVCTRDVTVPLLGTSGIVCVCPEIDDMYAKELSRTLYRKLSPSRTLVLTTVQKARCRGAISQGFYYLQTSKEPNTDGRNILPAPSFVDGVPAALLIEAEKAKQKLVVSIHVTDELSQSYADMFKMYSEIEQFAGTRRPNWLASRSEFEAAAKARLRSARTVSSAMYM